jgi:hypothetical protein
MPIRTLPIRTPRWLDRRSLEWHRRLSVELRKDPTHLQRARAVLLRWQSTDPRGCPGWDEWLALIDQGTDAAVDAMIDDGERGQYLRSCSPFTRVLPPRERALFFKQWSATS